MDVSMDISMDLSMDIHIHGNAGNQTKCNKAKIMNGYIHSAA